MKKNTSFRYSYLWLLLAVALVLLVGWQLLKVAPLQLGLEESNRIDLTPEQIKSIRDIGQWEFLAVTDEELVDTTRRGFFSDDHLARIYYGTLRLGVDLSQTDENWISTDVDTVRIVLPPITLLDEHFIDEARTRAFHESGRWSAEDREAMYRRAQQLMKAHALTPQNLRSAQDNADAQVCKLLHAMGFAHVSVEFRE